MQQKNLCLNYSISTHTLTWSVTLLFQYLVETFGDFNSHAHVERDTESSPTAQHSKHFNSHAHVERDLRVSALKKPPGISTHTLTWSVTIACRCRVVAKSFQLTRSRGA